AARGDQMSGRDAAIVSAADRGPTEMYLDAMAHASDRMDFQPGGRVTVGFSPRADDRSLVGGAPARPLPAGRASGRQMLASPQGASDVAGAGTAPAAPIDAPVDAPAVQGAIAAAPAVASLAGGSPVVAADAISGLRREVFGFLPYWEVGASSLTLDYNVLSTIAYFGVNADSAGNLVTKNGDGTTSTGWAGWTSAAMTNVINAAHQNHTRVVLTVEAFAWSTGQASTQAALLGSAAARLNLAQQTAAAVRDRGADGVNLDFEPIVSGYSDQFTAFVKTLRAQLDAIAPGYQLTFDTTGYIGNYPIADATGTGAADAVFIMGYDYRSDSSSTAGSIAPLGGPSYDITETVASYLTRIPASRIILGVPYYGRAWSTTTNALDAPNQSGATYGYSTAVVYDTAASLLSQYGRRYDPIEQVAWTVYQRQTCDPTCVTSWREMYVDDAQSLSAKYDLVNQRALRGVGIWALGYDGTRPELDQALYAKFVNDTTPPDVGIKVLPETQSDEGFVVGWTGWDQSGIASYDVQVSVDGGAWSGWIAGTTATSAQYLGASGHTYAFRVRGTDAKGNVSAWDVTSTGGAPASLTVGGFASVAADGLSIRAAATTSAQWLGSLSVGDTLSLTAGPVSADGYQWYQFSGPVTEWSPVGTVDAGVWAAAGAGGTPYLVPRMPANATRVQAGISALSLGARTFSPNGDGNADVVSIGWTAALAMSSLVFQVYRTDGSLVGSTTVPALGAGPQSWTWDGTLGGAPVPDGTYVIRLVGNANGTSYEAPGPIAVTSDTIARYSLTIDRFVTTRLGGADRYATAAAISAATFPNGAPVAYLATGLTFPDALGGAVAAARAGGPVLLVTATSLPSATATELARLHPTTLYVLGSTGVVPDAIAAAARAAASATSVVRLAGSDRYGTAAAISRSTFPNGAPVVYLATGLTFPDALGGAVAAARAGGPLLLLDPTRLPTATATELARLHPATLVVLGASGVTPDAIVSLAKAAAHASTVIRLAGVDRYATAAAISAATFPSGAPVAYIATGADFPDALGGAVTAARAGGPVLLVSSTALPSATATELARLRPTRLVALGSTAVVPDAIVAAAKTAAKGG
ncbi:MAG TPA: cell wall-binding repeat-containing protein, partial [Candidatus Dormibacteraeota bacterium]|nr:cell wall-binding repeat-containing protein [Candidatus Dormibacteraeota bacterium]